MAKVSFARLAVVVATIAAGCGTARDRAHSKVDPSDAARAEWLATGGHHWDSVAALDLEGTLIEGNVPGKFRKVIDLRRGWNRRVQDTGPMHSVTGFDGTEWVAGGNGIVNAIDLPSLVRSARSRAFVDRAGWRAGNESGTRVSRDGDDPGVWRYSPAGGSPVDVSFDAKTHLVSKVVIDTEGGPATTVFSDWRPVGDVKLAFRQVETLTDGEETTLVIEQARLLDAVGDESFARPASTPHGSLASSEPARVPFTYVGSHIRVPMSVDGVPSNVIFDTGAANYFSPASAKRFGLEVGGGLNLGGVGESSTVGGFARAGRIALGSAELRDQIVIVGPVPWGDRPGADGVVCDGTAGYEFMAEFRTTIDYPAQTLELADPSSPAPTSGRGTKVPFWSDGHSMFVEADVEGHRGTFCIDTGSGDTVTLFPTFAKENELGREAGEKVVSGEGIGGKVSSRPVTLSRFTLAGAEFRDLPAHLSENRTGVFASRSLAGNLGGGLLRCFRITIDYAARTVTFEPGSEDLSDCVAARRAKG